MFKLKDAITKLELIIWKKILLKSRCGKIGLMKFIFALTILAQHTNAKFPGNIFTFSAGSAAVEFFFTVSIYLLCKKYLNYQKNEDIGETTTSFLFTRIKRFAPYIIFLLIISIPFQIFWYITTMIIAETITIENEENQ